jgi:proteasome lid subunit RPN8/RPN11
VAKLKLSSSLRDQMLAHVKACYPEEACGILGGLGEEVKLVIAVENELHSRVRFRMRPEQQLRALLNLEQEGLDLIGIWHSHPNGPEFPSPTDMAEATYPEALALIWGRPDHSEAWGLRAFRLDSGGFDEIAILSGWETSNHATDPKN